jgi:hypothetical protein
MQDPYVPYQSENANEPQPTTRPNTAIAQPIQTPHLTEIPNVSSTDTAPPVLTTSKVKAPDVSASATSNSIDVTAEPREAKNMAPTIPVTTDPNANIRGGGTLLYLAFFASVGLNFYLGWITWDTYNRYQDMVSDIRHSNTSARRERVERGRDSADRRKDRHLVDSSAY